MNMKLTKVEKAKAIQALCIKTVKSLLNARLAFKDDDKFMHEAAIIINSFRSHLMFITGTPNDKFEVDGVVNELKSEAIVIDDVSCDFPCNLPLECGIMDIEPSKEKAQDEQRTHRHINDTRQSLGRHRIRQPGIRRHHKPTARSHRALRG